VLERPKRWEKPGRVEGSHLANFGYVITPDLRALPALETRGFEKSSYVGRRPGRFAHPLASPR
jgi:hypothetical protein